MLQSGTKYFRNYIKAQTYLLDFVFFISDDELLEMVREVSEDHMYDTIEFNEFLQMMSKQQKKGLTQDILKDAFRQGFIY